VHDGGGTQARELKRRRSPEAAAGTGHDCRAAGEGCHAAASTMLVSARSRSSVPVLHFVPPGHYTTCMTTSQNLRSTDLTGSVAFVTGAASGIGRASARLLVEAGARRPPPPRRRGRGPGPPPEARRAAHPRPPPVH